MIARLLLAMGLGWLVPGLGHVVVGRVDKALYFGVLVIGTFALGVWLGEGASVSPERYPYHWWGQILAGGPALLAERVWGRAPLGRTVDTHEIGTVFTAVAGILNLIVIADAYYEGRGANHDPREASS